MTRSELRDLIWARITRSGLQADSSLLDRLTIYLQLLARWDSRINLTGFSMNPPTTAAVDRLLVEPLQLVSLVGPPVGLWADLGSGGGSPALPLHLRQPANELWLIESKERKAAFLREAIRELGLSNVRVEVARIESIASD